MSAPREPAHQAPAGATAPAACAEGVRPEDIAAWSLDGEAVDGVTDPAAHVAGCAACTAAIESVGGSRGVAAALLAAVPATPPDLVALTMARVRSEWGVLLLVRTLGGAAARVAAALPDYLGAATPPPGRGLDPRLRDRGADEDTAELDGPDSA